MAPLTLFQTALALPDRFALARPRPAYPHDAGIRWAALGIGPAVFAFCDGPSVRAGGRAASGGISSRASCAPHRVRLETPGEDGPLGPSGSIYLSPSPRRTTHLRVMRSTDSSSVRAPSPVAGTHARVCDSSLSRVCGCWCHPRSSRGSNRGSRRSSCRSSWPIGSELRWPVAVPQAKDRPWPSAPRILRIFCAVGARSCAACAGRSYGSRCSPRASNP